MLNSIETVYSPLLYPYKLTQKNFITVVVDIFRASTSICAAMGYGITEIIPVGTTDAARKKKEEGYLVACERNGEVLDFADIGNSPSDFTKKELVDQSIVFSTTNGTKAIELAKDASEVLIGSFLNLSHLSNYLQQQKKNVVVLCAAWKNLYNLEDSLFAGALSAKLLEDVNNFATVCDSTKAAMDLWLMAQADLPGYLSKTSHRHRLNHILSEEDFHNTLQVDSMPCIPVMNQFSIKNKDF